MKAEELEYHIDNILTCNGGQILRDQLKELFIEFSQYRCTEQRQICKEAYYSAMGIEHSIATAIVNAKSPEIH